MFQPTRLFKNASFLSKQHALRTKERGMIGITTTLPSPSNGEMFYNGISCWH